MINFFGVDFNKAFLNDFNPELHMLNCQEHFQPVCDPEMESNECHSELIA